MSESDVVRAVEAARTAVGAPADAEASWRWVVRLDAGTGRYLLVGLSAGESGWVAAVSADGDVRSWAADPAGARAWWTEVEGELVWAPGSWSRSPLYPLRRVTRAEGTVLLDHEGVEVPETPPLRG
jgi:hypothetical protein